MSRPTHLLKREHRVIEQAMRALEGMCLRMRTGGDAPNEELSKLLDFIRNHADRFHLKFAEEMLVGQVKDSLIHAFAEGNADAREWTQRYEQLARELEKTWAA